MGNVPGGSHAAWLAVHSGIEAPSIGRILSSGQTVFCRAMEGNQLDINVANGAVKTEIYCLSAEKPILVYLTTD